ncbi:MAG: glycosyltransferase family 4 protein [Anaerolineae bacterium]|nr:glycosyltransferase family 4 protein [Anaerolineae bacterium]
MRVLMISKALVAGIYQRKLEGIAAQGVELLALTPAAWRDERGAQPLERAYTDGYRLETLPIWFNGSFHLHVYPTLGRWMRAFRPHIVHIDEEPYNLASWAALAAAKRVGAQPIFFTWQNLYREYPIPFRWGEGWVLREVRQAIAGTESAAHVLREKGYTGDVAVIPQFGIDPDLFRPAGARPERPFTVGCAARLVPEKGVDLLLRAVARMDDATAVRIIGGGPERRALEALADSLGLGARVTFVEQVASMAMPGQYHRFDVLAVPSRTTPTWKEQFGPRASVEAMASGVPVVGSDSGAIPGVVGEGGLIVPEGDVEALAGALCRLRDDAALRAEIGRRGRERALADFTHAQVARATVAVYQSMLI